MRLSEEWISEITSIKCVVASQEGLPGMSDLPLASFLRTGAKWLSSVLTVNLSVRVGQSSLHFGSLLIKIRTAAIINKSYDVT